MSNTRNVFVYKRGDKEYYFDPLDTYLNLIDAMEQNGIDPNNLIAVNNGTPIDQLRFSRQLAKCVQAAFNLRPFSTDYPEGWTIQETLELLQAFNEYSAGVKKNTEDSQNVAQSTAPVT